MLALTALALVRVCLRCVVYYETRKSRKKRKRDRASERASERVCDTPGVVHGRARQRRCWSRPTRTRGQWREETWSSMRGLGRHVSWQIWRWIRVASMSSSVICPGALSSTISLSVSLSLSLSLSVCLSLSLSLSLSLPFSLSLSLALPLALSLSFSFSFSNVASFSGGFVLFFVRWLPERPSRGPSGYRRSFRGPSGSRSGRSEASLAPPAAFPRSQWLPERPF